MMIDKELEILIEEIRELSSIPEFKKSILHKVNELKALLREDIEVQQKIDAMLRDKKSYERHDFKGHLFHLNRVGKDTWLPTIPGIAEISDQSNHCNIFEIIPRSIINFITHYRTKVGVAVMLPGQIFPDLEDRKFDLIFEKQNEDWFTGIIKETASGAAKNGRILKNSNHSNIMETKEHALKNIKQLNHYLLKNDDFYHHVISDFLTRWKPLIDSQHLEITAK
jgi:hypothetical protein